MNINTGYSNRHAVLYLIRRIELFAPDASGGHAHVTWGEGFHKHAPAPTTEDFILNNFYLDTTTF